MRVLGSWPPAVPLPCLGRCAPSAIVRVGMRVSSDAVTAPQGEERAAGGAPGGAPIQRFSCNYVPPLLGLPSPRPSLAASAPAALVPSLRGEASSPLKNSPSNQIKSSLAHPLVWRTLWSGSRSWRGNKSEARNATMVSVAPLVHPLAQKRRSWGGNKSNA